MKRLQEGTIKAAVIISDLLITKNGHFLGAPGLLDSSNTRDLLLSGLSNRKLDLALLGIPLRYHGISRGGYDGRWWFNDCENQYKRLPEPVERPLYVLIVGLKSSNTNAVISIASRLENIIEELDSSIEVAHRTFSASIRAGHITWEPVTPRRGPLYFADEPGSYYCRFPRSSVSSKGKLVPPARRLSSVSVIPNSAVEWFEAAKVGQEIQLTILCDKATTALNRAGVQEALSARLDLGVTWPDNNNRWKPLHSTTCQPEGTYGLNYLIDILNPDAYRARSSVPFVMKEEPR